MEAGVLIDLEGNPLYWHVPDNRSTGYLPDSPDLWKVVWENRTNLLGYAHSHPGGGTPGPSREDITTFSAMELGIGKKLIWWIISESTKKGVVQVRWIGPNQYDYASNLYDDTLVWKLPWYSELRSKSYNEAPKGFVWVCSACGKRAKDKVTGGLARGWDVSCFLHAVLHHEDSIKLNDSGLVCSAKAADGDPLTNSPEV